MCLCEILQKFRKLILLISNTNTRQGALNDQRLH